MAKLTSIKNLIADSINLFEKTVLQLLLVMAVFWAAVIAMLLVSGVIGALLFSGIFVGNAGALSLISVVMGIILVLALTVGFVVAATVANIAPILIVGRQEENLGFRRAIKKSFPYVIPFYLTGLLSGLLLFGSFFVGVLPVIFFAYLFIFTSYEVVLGNHSYWMAIRRSIMVVLGNFGPILVRLLILLGIYIVLVAIPSALVGESKSAVAVLVGIYSFLINVFLGYFSVCYMITVYKQVSFGMKDKQPSGYSWVWIVSLIGWFLFFGLLVVIAKLALPFLGSIISPVTTPPMMHGPSQVVPPFPMPSPVLPDMATPAAILGM